MKYQVSIDKETMLATITNQETNVSVSAKLQPYTRTKNGETIQHLQLKFDPTLLDCENNGVVQVPKNSAGRFLTEFETNLTSKTESSTKLSFDMFE